jgi:hypothetical protein
MIPDDLIKAISDRNEGIVKKRFKRMKMKPIRLDNQGPRKRPEFLVVDGSEQPVVICEVKTIFSAGYLEDQDVHLSTADQRFMESPRFSGVPVDFAKIDENMANAVCKYKVLLKDRPELVGVPLVVDFFFDWYADYFDLYDRRMEPFPDVSGILQVCNDHLIQAKAEKMTLEELEDRILSGSMKGIGPTTKAFKLVENECATVKLPRHFVEWCIT